MHLRVTSEAEMMGLDYDQFGGEQIGDWSIMDQNHYEANVSSSSSQNVPTSVPAAAVGKQS
jgi:Amt family ammonium transporter